MTKQEQLEHAVATQHSAKKGLRTFGEDGAQATLKEMKQLDTQDVMEPVKHDMLTAEEKKKALEHLMFLKKKHCGKIEGRGCADGRKQRTHKGKDETSSPTTTTESPFLSCVIDAKERRDVATIDVPGAFMQADIDELVHARLAGPLATLMARVDPKKRERFTHHDSKGRPVLHAKLNKALCGMLQAALPFWKNLTSVLEGWGFELNPRDSCVANADIEGSQCATLWHVDDLKIGHVNPAVVSEMTRKPSEQCGKESPLTERRGKAHDCLGMTVDCSIGGKVAFTMDDCVRLLVMTTPTKAQPWIQPLIICLRSTTTTPKSWIRQTQTISTRGGQNALPIQESKTGHTGGGPTRMIARNLVGWCGISECTQPCH